MPTGEGQVAQVAVSTTHDQRVAALSRAVRSLPGRGRHPSEGGLVQAFLDLLALSAQAEGPLEEAA